MTIPELNINPDIRQIILTKGKVAIVDSNDYEYLSQWKWCCSEDGYAVRSEKSNERKNNIRKQIKMHRVIMNPISKINIDHIDGDKLNNCKHNLRIATTSQNGMNRKKSANCTSKFKGVYWNKTEKKWKVTIRSNSKYYHLGYFKSETEAAIAYNNKAKELHGEFANLNVIN